MALVSTLFRLKALIPYHYVISRHNDELRNVKPLIQTLKVNDIVVYDRLFLTINTLTMHHDLKIHGVFRLRKGGTLKEVTDFIKSGKRDVVVKIQRKDLPEMQLRFLRYQVKSETYYIATTLLDQNKFSISDIKDLYYQRWGIEEQYKSFKQTIKIEEFHSKSILGIKQEIGVFFCFMRLLGYLVFSVLKRN